MSIGPVQTLESFMPPSRTYGSLALFTLNVLENDYSAFFYEELDSQYGYENIHWKLN